MGVYIFRSTRGDWIKIGHHKLTPSRPNVYYRIARRGFHSCVHPTELAAFLDAEHFELVRWYPSLGRRDETHAHRACLASCGEFHPGADLARAVECLDRRGASRPVGDEARRQAYAWAGKSV